MAKSLTEIRSLARSHTEAALNALLSVMNQPESPPAARVSAANAILDRGWGKPMQPISGDGEGGPLQMVTRIELVAAPFPGESES